MIWNETLLPWNGGEVMTLMPFSIPDHVSLLLLGAKRQTTTHPRKTPVKVGDILHCWYKPRQKNTCGNCIVPNCADANRITADDGEHQLRISVCSKHTNFFGKAKVTGILHFDMPCYLPTDRSYQETVERTDVNGCGMDWHFSYFGNRPETFMEEWARADGFANLQEAHKWFMISTKSDMWMFLPWDVIIFEPDWVK